MFSCAILSLNDCGLGQIFLVIYNSQTYGFSFSLPFFSSNPHIFGPEHLFSGPLVFFLKKKMLSCAILSQNDRGLGQIFLLIHNPQSYGFSFSSPRFRIFLQW